jgi:hypothetical protein
MLQQVENDEKIRQVVLQKIHLLLKNICQNHADVKMNHQDCEMIDVMTNVHGY